MSASNVDNEESVHSKGSARSKTSISSLSRNGMITQIEEKAFLFLVAIRLSKPLPNWIFVLLNVLVMQQTLSLGWESGRFSRSLSLD